MGGQIPEAALQGSPIVEAWAHHDLSMDLEVPFPKPVQLLHQQSSSGVHQQPFAQGRFGGMH